MFLCFFVQSYSDIIESHFLFGKCPFSWNRKSSSFILEWECFKYYKFWIKILLSCFAVISPMVGIYVRNAVNRLTPYHYDDNVPSKLIAFYLIMSIIAFGMFLILLPLVLFWDEFGTPELRRQFIFFSRLQEGMTTAIQF